jgi:hypothetical protein
MVYFTTPFNSNADYNVLFREASGNARSLVPTPPPLWRKQNLCPAVAPAAKWSHFKVET